MLSTIFMLGLSVAQAEEPPPVISGANYRAVLIPAGVTKIGCTSDKVTDCVMAVRKKKKEERGKAVYYSKAKVEQPFYIMETEVTRQLWQEVFPEMKKKEYAIDRVFCTSNCPVEGISWLAAADFANQLSKKEGLEQCYNLDPLYGNAINTLVSSIEGNTDLEGTMNIMESIWNRDCNGWRLPTAVEWEYAARGGENYKYAGSDSKGAVAVKSRFRKLTFGDLAVSAEGIVLAPLILPIHRLLFYAPFGGPRSVCSKQKNGYGLCDMSGNMQEWVWDWTYQDTYAYGKSYKSMMMLTVKGSSYSQVSTYKRSHFVWTQHRYPLIGIFDPDVTEDAGFRLVRNP